MTKNDHEALADELEQEANKLQEQSEKLGHEASAIRQDWERKRADPSVPGAPERQDSESSAGDPEGAPQGDDPKGAAEEEDRPQAQDGSEARDRSEAQDRSEASADK